MKTLSRILARLRFHLELREAIRAGRADAFAARLSHQRKPEKHCQRDER
jgi:hypothetical protein